MEYFKLLFQLYIKPAFGMSEIIDRGSWLTAVLSVLVVAMAFFATVNQRLDEAYSIPNFSEFYSPDDDENITDQEAEATYNLAKANYGKTMASRQTIPLIGARFFKFFSFDPAAFYQPLLSLSVFYVPTVILLMSIFGGVGSFGLVLRREYGTLATCSLMAWAAGHLPIAVAGILLYWQTATGSLLSSQATVAPVFLGLWVAGGLLFGVFMVFALRTVLGANYATAVLVVCLAWLSLSLGTLVFQYISPWLFSPFLIFFAVMYLGGSIGGEVRGFGNALRQKQNLKRFLQNATVNPKDADAHVQLGLIYLQRRQESKAIEHLNKAVEIDENEIDANYELGKLARSRGDLQAALDHFAIVVEQNDKHSLSEVWREIGETYFAANMLGEARDALEKFTIRRSADVEGLYYLGKVLKAKGEPEKAREVFEQAIQSANASPDFRRRDTKHWSKLVQKEL
jgi:tetratricopeptide (TPR) repeat protein